jgi:RNA polymerase sigma-70 factor (ECF subfamily)
MVACVIGIALSGPGIADELADDAPKQPTKIIKYGDGKADGKKSLAGSGEMITFVLPDASQKLSGVRLHCGRYGYPEPPDEDVEITIVDSAEEDGEVIQAEFVPYRKFQRGENRWHTFKFEQPIHVPETFWVVFNFNAERTKGVYVSFDTATEGKYSRTGLPGTESEEVEFGGDWMVQAILTKPE